MNVKVTSPAVGIEGTLTTEHPCSRDGLPVLLVGHSVYRPGDKSPGLDALENYQLIPEPPLTPEEVGMAEQAGWWMYNRHRPA